MPIYIFFRVSFKRHRTVRDVFFSGVIIHTDGCLSASYFRHLPEDLRGCLAYDSVMSFFWSHVRHGRSAANQLRDV